MEMDSPPNKLSKPSANTNNTATETALAQDSPVFNFISNLSPIQPVKAPPVTQGFPGLNSPPLIFRSPRLNPNSQPILLKRAHFLGLSAAKLSEVDEGCKNDVVVNASEKLVAQLSSRLTTCTEKASDSNSPVNDPNESPKECPDQFLTDIVNMDSADPNVSAESATEKSKHIDQPLDAVTDSKESVGKLDQESDIGINDEIAGVPPVITRQVEEVHKDYTSVDVIALETDVNQDNSISVDHCQKVERELPSDSALTNHDQELQHVKKGQAGPLDRPSNSTSGSVQIGKENGNFVYSTGGICEPAMKRVQHDFEALQHHGIRRRCLQFEDVQHMAISNQPVQNATESGDLTSQSSETQLTPINGNQAAVKQPVNPRGMSSTIKVPKPSGIGLHLNSILNAVQPGCGAVVNVKSAQRVNFCIRGKKSMSMINSYAADNSKNSSVSPPVESVSASPDGNRHENHASVAANSTNSLSCTVNPPNNSVISNPVEDQLTPCNKRKCNFENDGSGEFKSSPKKKRKKSSDSNDGDGCKRCNCKKSKCLKLYCDCFAAGIYCAETCSCQGCFNRPEYENMVLETRQQIESRNPLAFAPKVVQHIAEPPGSSYGEDGTHFTPSSARHKRGCNCKKSMCLKKYCECYQANVGCSDGCRCEGCKNVYGKKGEYGMIKGVIGEVDANEQTESSFAEKMAVASESGLYQTTELCDPHNLTPLTPALQFLNYGDDASRAWFHSGKYFQSPESNLPHVAPYMMSPVSPRNSENNNAISLETAKGILDQASFDQELEFHDIPNPQEGANNPKTLSFAGNNNCSSAGSLHWRGSPNTPMAESSGTKLVHQIVVSDAELSNFMQDDTPEILKDNPSPRNAVKVSSPNKKRVSPPHGRPHELSSSSSSAGLRTGRKFILKAVPSFPPLTPCIDSKNIALQQTSDPRNSTAKK